MPNAADAEKNFWVAITGFGAILGTGLYVLAEQQWVFGSIFTVGGGVGLLLMSPLVRSKLGSWPSRKTLIAAIAVTWVFLAANIGLSIFNRISPPSGTGVAGGGVPPRTGKMWPPLTDEQETTLESALKAIPTRGPIRIICISSECRELAGNLIGAFHNAGWEPLAAFSGPYNEPVGIVHYLTNINDHALANAIEKSINVKIEHIEPTSDPTLESVFVGIKP